MHDEDAISRPETPISPLASSLYHATTTIDDLTMALANFSRVASPEPPTLLSCCCNREECEILAGWLDCKSRLESRLTLSAEVGQALLQRHEAYVRRHEGRKTIQGFSRRVQSDDDDEDPVSLIPSNSQYNLRELVKEKTMLEKRLTQALVNTEVTEISNKTILRELQEARSTISRLTAQHARSLGWEGRLSATISEKEDMQQERDSESQRARLAESRFAVMKDKTVKLQAEVRRLQDALEERRLHRLESSETLIRDARIRLESLHNSIGQTAFLAEQTELTTVLESLVNDNETLKRDNAELQYLLTESREEIHALQGEVEEQRANPPRIDVGTPPSRVQILPGSVPSSLMKGHILTNFNPRSASIERKSRLPFEPLTPETSKRPLSPTDSLAPSETRWSTSSQPRPQYASSHISFEIDEAAGNDGGPTSPEKPKTHRTLLLLTRSRGVQTDSLARLSSPPSLLPSSISSTSHYDPRSESSSYSESSSSLSLLLERLITLNNRMIQADALTLTNRLKRQHLKGADVGHLSRSTVNNIISEVNSLRGQFRSLFEDETIITSCTRKDFRLLFKLFKESFVEMGQMRVSLNDVILDPAQAPRISELALNPSKLDAETREKERETAGSLASGWMAPLSKLFSPSGRGDNQAEDAGLTRPVSGRGTSRPPRFIPKLGPALSASATTVNVEFSGTGVGRSTTSTVARRPPSDVGESSEIAPTSSGVMGIFAGASMPTESVDPWIVLPKAPRRMQSFANPAHGFNSATTRGRANNNRSGSSRLSRDVDAVIDVQRPLQAGEEADSVGPLLERTLRRRGLSDSSIQSTYTSHAEDPRTQTTNLPTDDGIASQEAPSSVFQTLSRTVQNFRMTTPGTAMGSLAVSLSPKKPSVAERRKLVETARTPSTSLHSLLPNLTSWAAAGSMLDPMTGAEPFAGSVRADSLMQRARRPGQYHGPEHFDV